jgi:hypothetical protein
MKKLISIRLDTEIIDFFKKAHPDSYQKAISKVLKDHIAETTRQAEFKAGRAQELFEQFYTQCFWHLKKDLKITPELLPIVIKGLRKHGGLKGMALAHKLEQV